GRGGGGGMPRGRVVGGESSGLPRRYLRAGLSGPAACLQPVAFRTVPPSRPLLAMTGGGGGAWKGRGCRCFRLLRRFTLAMTGRAMSHAPRNDAFRVILSAAKNPYWRSKKGTATISHRSRHRSMKAEELSKACGADRALRGNGDSPHFRAKRLARVRSVRSVRSVGSVRSRPRLRSRAGQDYDCGRGSG